MIYSHKAGEQPFDSISQLHPQGLQSLDADTECRFRKHELTPGPRLTTSRAIAGSLHTAERELSFSSLVLIFVMLLTTCYGDVAQHHCNCVSCSATLTCLDATSLFKLGNELVNILDLSTTLTLGRLGNLEDFLSWLDRVLESKVLQAELLEWLLLGLHDVRQRCVSWLVETKIGGHNEWKFGLDNAETTVNLSCDLSLCALLWLAGWELELGSVCCLRPVEETSKHLTGLRSIVVDGLLAHDDKPDLLFLTSLLNNLGKDLRNTEGLKWIGAGLVWNLDVDGIVGTHSEGSSEDISGLGWADGDDGLCKSNEKATKIKLAACKDDAAES